MKSSGDTRILWSAVFVWFGAMLFLSFQTGAETAETSGKLARIIFRALLALGVRISYSSLHQMLRTAAHVIVFLIFGVLLKAAVTETLKQTAGTKSKTHGLIVLLVCAGVAVMSEVIKIYIPGRHLDWPEAGLNVLSAWLGCGMMHAVQRLCEKRKKA